MTTPESDNFISRYAREGGVWVYRSPDGGTGQMVFTATILGIRIQDSTGPQGRFLFRRGFAWVPKMKTWIQMHFP